MHHIRFSLGLRPKKFQTPLRELTVLPQTSQLDLMSLVLRGRRGGEGKREGSYAINFCFCTVDDVTHVISRDNLFVDRLKGSGLPTPNFVVVH